MEARKCIPESMFENQLDTRNYSEYSYANKNNSHYQVLGVTGFCDRRSLVRGVHMKKPAKRVSGGFSEGLECLAFHPT